VEISFPHLIGRISSTTDEGFQSPSFLSPLSATILLEKPRFSDSSSFYPSISSPPFAFSDLLAVGALNSLKSLFPPPSGRNAGVIGPTPACRARSRVMFCSFNSNLLMLIVIGFLSPLFLTVISAPNVLEAQQCEGLLLLTFFDK